MYKSKFYKICFINELFFMKLFNIIVVLCEGMKDIENEFFLDLVVK